MDRADIVPERRPVILAGRLQPVEDLDHGRARVRLEAAIAAIRPDEGVRLLRTGSKDAARAVILERAADEMDAIGQQRRGERVALIAGIGLDVKVKAHGPAGVHPALAGDALGRHFCPPPASTSPTPWRGRPAL